MIYRSFFENRKNYKGFYVDVGAHHPYRFSNTLYFYQQGWRGINIEPTPGSINLFRFLRKRDINLDVGVSTSPGSLPFYCFDEPALNSFNKGVSEEKSKTTRYKITRVIAVKTLPLAQVLDCYLPDGQAIDFLNVDAEGLDLEVLKSNNWEKYVPLFIMIEIGADIKNLVTSETYRYLTDKSYELVAKTGRTAFFKLIKKANII